MPGAWSELTPAFRHCRHCPVMAMCLRVQPPRPLCVGLGLRLRVDLSWFVALSLHLKMTGHSAQFAREDMRRTAWRPTPPELLDSGWGKCRSGFLGFFVTISPQEEAVGSVAVHSRWWQQRGCRLHWVLLIAACSRLVAAWCAAARPGGTGSSPCDGGGAGVCTAVVVAES